jgi:type II secretory pathway pseudopilin PulG
MRRVNSQSGIAIGPILFVVAILAILATAIAAGSSTFATSSSQETNRTNASSMVQIGQNLKLGVDRLVALGTSLANVDINASNTTGNSALFSPTGGGLVPPSSALSNSGSDSWIYTWGEVTNAGTTALERIAALKVTQGVCDQVNTIVGNGATPAGADLGAIANDTNFSAWPAGLAGKMVGCVNNSNGSVTGYFFYQILSIQ